jgi:hypothetical protein
MKYRNIAFIFIIVLMASNRSFSQECGPFCPVCSGTGSSTSALVSPGVLIPNFLYIPNGEEETGVLNLRGGVTPWLDAGVGYAIEAEKYLWSFRLQALVEDEASLRPSLIIGTGSVQTGKSDQSLFVQVSKSWEFNELFSMRLSTGVASLLPDIEEYYGLAGITLTITENWSPFLSYDGINFHPGLSWIFRDKITIAGILIESKEPAISIGFRYDLLNSAAD